MSKASPQLLLFFALVRKSILNHVVRRPISFLLSFYVIPALILSLLLCLPTMVSHPSTYGVAAPASIKPLADTVNNKLVIVRPPEPGSDIQRVVAEITKPLDSEKVVVVDSEEKLHAICFKDTDSACDAAVTFYDSPETMSQNRTWKYTIRADKRGTSNAEYLSHSGQIESLYMPLQLAINNAITNASAIPEVFMFSTSKDSNDNMRRQDAAAMIGSIYTFALFGCFFVMIYKFTTWVTTERESGMARLVDSMGSQWCLPARILSWILVIDLICLPLFLVFGLLYWKLAFPLSDALPLIGWQVVLGLAVNSSAAFAATFFRKARVSAIYVTAMFIILSLATQLFMVRTQPEPIPPVIWALASIFPSSNHALFTKQMATWQGANMKAEFSGFPGSRSADPDLHVVTQNSSLLILAGQFVVYALLAMVSEWAFHGPSSRRRHFGTEQCQTNEPSVQVEGLRMVFKPGFWTRLCCCGRRDTVTAIRNVHLQGHKSQILCLAGPNGSGKTTTLHAMAGFIRPTSGRVSMNARREQIGICPQQNTLWDDLTVCEHVQIWSQIKGGQESQVQINELIAACDLTIKRNSLAKTLSGGQKRKLQLACMFVGGSTVCLIDECTSGLDPLSRRVIWDLLLKYRTGRSIIFTTHFLDEVDVLADHTVILSAGTVRCQGSPAELYSRYGKGYKVSIPKDAAQTVIDGPWQTRHHQGKLVYTVPDSRSAAQLAKRFVTNGLSDVAISGPQFEDVFLKATGEAEYSTNTLDSQQPFDLSPGETTSFLSQLAILLGKRFLVLPKLWWPYFFAVLLPVAVTPALLLIVSEYQPAQCAHWKPAIGAPQMRSFLYTTTCSETGYCAKMVIAPDEAKTELRSIVEKRFDDVREVNLTLFDEFTIPLDSRETWLDYIRSHRDTGSYSGIYTGSGNNAPIIAYRPESSAFTSGFELLSLWSQMSSGVQIKAQHAVLRDMPNQEDGFPIIFSIFFLLIQSLYPAAFVLYPAIEKSSKTRAMQFANGVRCGPLLLAYALFDSVFVIFTSLVVTSILAAAISWWVGSVWLMAVVLILYGLTAILVGQVMLHFASGPLKSFLAVFGLYMAMFATAAGAFGGATMASPQAATAVAFGLGLFLPIGNVFRSLIIGLNIAGEGCANGNVKSSSSMDSYSGPIFYLFLQVVALATISVWLEGGLAIFSRKIPLPRSTDVEMHQRYVPGGDVETETLRTEREDADMLRVLHVTKSFKSNVALNDVSFGLPAGEVLALIGPNGAGKSTLINIIQSELAATTGDVMLCADNSRKRSARKYLGVCPQHDALDLLNTRQHLTFYGRIRGVKNLKENVEYLLKRLHLTPYAKTAASKLSGGNKRKLSLAIALMGAPRVIALDEPTTAMDAIAKRAFWEIVRSATLNRSILLTTHSMEEADTLARRAAILATRMLAIGTTQELRTQHGSECHVHVQLKSAPESTFDEMKAFWEFICTRVSGVTLERDMSRGQIRFAVPTAHCTEHGSSKIIRISEIMEESKEALGVAYYSVSDSTLEGAFLNVIQANDFQVADDGVKKVSLRQRLRRML